jgi:hypothetical protein
MVQVGKPVEGAQAGVQGAQRLEDAVRARWQPRIREQARRQAATSTGIMIDTRARFGFTAAPGITDDARLGQLTIVLPPPYAGRLFDAQEAGASEQQLRNVDHALEPEAGAAASDRSPCTPRRPSPASCHPSRRPRPSRPRLQPQKTRKATADRRQTTRRDCPAK